jgi:integrase
VYILKIVQERLGHSGIAITLDLYSHVAPGLQQAAANKFDDIVLPKRKDTVDSD